VSCRTARDDLLYGPCSHYRVKAMLQAFSIGELAKAMDTKVETIRYYGLGFCTSRHAPAEITAPSPVLTWND
jgi:hypothetical protein